MSENARWGITVEWDKGRVTGFASKKDAQRFIERICRKTAPDIDYNIYSLFEIKKK